MAKDTSNKQKLSSAQKAYLSRMKNLISSSSAFQSLLLEVRQQGKNYIRQTERLESKQFDSKFVDELEKGFDAIDTIITNPRTFIKDEPELVEAGLAKKINAQSITHLASHTQFVHSVDKKGNVTPEKILTIHAEIDTQIYENRFVMTLIKKCSLFIEKRFNYIKDHGETLDSDLILLKSTSNIDGAKYEIDSRIKVSSPSKDNGNKEKNEDILKRLVVLRERCSYLMRSPFMVNDMAGAKDVANPIHMTNMIVKNPYYHAAYELWKFIDSYTDLGVSYSVSETEQDFTQEYFEEIFALVLADMLTLHSNRVKDRQIENKKVKDKIINPKVLFTLEDETFHDGKFLYDQFPEHKKERTSPMALTPEEAREERLRMEENYRDEVYKKTLVDEEIEKQKSIDIAKEAVERQKLLEQLQKARLKEQRAIQKALEKQKREEERRLKEEQEKARKEEMDELERTREQIRLQAEADKGYKEPIKPVEEEVEDIYIAQPVEEISFDNENKEEENLVDDSPIVPGKRIKAEFINAKGRRIVIYEKDEPLPREPIDEESLIDDSPIEEPIKEEASEPMVPETPAEPVVEDIPLADEVEDVPSEPLPVEEIELNEDENANEPEVEEFVSGDKRKIKAEFINAKGRRVVIYEKEEPVNDTPIENKDESPLEEQPQEDVPSNVEESPVEPEKIEESPVEVQPIEETPIETEPSNNEEESIEEPSENVETPIEPERTEPIEENQVEESTHEVDDSLETEPVSEPIVEETPKENPQVEEPVNEPEEIEESPVEVQPIEESPAVTEPSNIEETPVEEPSENVETPSKEETEPSKKKFVRDVPSFRAEKDYVFIKTRKSSKAKKVVLKGKLK